MSPASGVGTVARRMLDTPTFHAIVRVGPKVGARDVARDIAAELAAGSTRACWLHEAHDLKPVFRLALDHKDTPMVVTTDTDDWSPFEGDRRWTRRMASLVFVLSQRALETVPSQMSRLIPCSYEVRRNVLLHDGDEVVKVRRHARALLCHYVPETARLLLLAEDVGIVRARIDASGAPELVASHVLNEALRADCLDRLIARLHEDYPRPDVADLMRVIRDLYHRAED